MSEELLQTEARPIGRYSYYKLGATTLQQLRNARVIKTSVPEDLRKKKPDGLITLHGGATKAVIEYKRPAELRTKAQIQEAIAQELLVARALCKVLIVTCGSRTIWVNALNGERIRTSPEDELRFTVDVKVIGKPDFDAQKFEQLLDSAEVSLTATTNLIAAPSVLDPSSLANTIWQKIWVQTGKSPEKCLYNVVELFVFKFLTDLGVLKPHAGFWSVAKLTETGSPADALTQYAQIGRKAVQKLFPAGEDGTTIINGTIFVNEAGAPNIAQAGLFAEIVKDLAAYDAAAGSFRYIKREFKTRLYESFLRQSAGVKALGQYFTPRNVVQAMVRMTRQVSRGARICDPFCGVGGFLLELLVENDELFREFAPAGQGQLAPQITLVGYDKGTDEQEDERTIILAKANMLIYFSDLLAERHGPDELKAFCEHGLNSVFRLLRTNLGTFDKTDDEPYDLILTNPPYVTKGTKSLQDALATCERTAQFYDFGLKGTEGLALNWIIKKLRPRGEAFVIVPDTMLHRKTALRKIEEHCRVLGVVALPNRTFYATRRQTYILALEKKSDARKQQHPVFAYIVREIGETRDWRRIAIPDNDLEEMVTLFRQFRAAPAGFTPPSGQCKVVPFDTVTKLNDWRVDRRWWSYEERVELGLETPLRAVDYDTFVNEIDELGARLQALAGQFRAEEAATASQTRTVTLGDPTVFGYVTTVTGWDEEEVQRRGVESDNGAPVYRAAVGAVGHALPNHDKLIAASPANPLISFAANGDGSAGTNFVFHNRPFFVTGDRTVLRIRNPDIYLGYVLYALRNMKRKHGFDHTHKAVPQNLAGVAFEVPVTEAGEWDVEAQRRIARRHERILEYVEMLGSRVNTAASCDVKSE